MRKGEIKMAPKLDKIVKTKTIPEHMMPDLDSYAMKRIAGIKTKPYYDEVYSVNLVKLKVKRDGFGLPVGPLGEFGGVDTDALPDHDSAMDNNDKERMYHAIQKIKAVLNHNENQPSCKKLLVEATKLIEAVIDNN
jgi:hypothetical protein